MIKCPILETEIDIGECVVIVDACEGSVKETVLSEAVLENSKWKEICRMCKYHSMIFHQSAGRWYVFTPQIA